MILTYISIETLIYLFKSHGFAKRIAMHYDKKLFIKGVSENPHSLDTFVQSFKCFALLAIVSYLNRIILVVIFVSSHSMQNQASRMKCYFKTYIFIMRKLFVFVLNVSLVKISIKYMLFQNEFLFHIKIYVVFISLTRHSTCLSHEEIHVECLGGHTST